MDIFEFKNIKGIKPKITVGELKQILNNYDDNLTVSMIMSFQDPQTELFKLGCKEITAIAPGYVLKEDEKGERHPLCYYLGFGDYDTLEHEDLMNHYKRSGKNPEDYDIEATIERNKNNK